MSAERVLAAAVLAALQASPALASGTNGVFAGPPVAASRPFVEVAPIVSVDWSTKDARGREANIGATIRDASDTTDRLLALAEAAEAALAVLPVALPGWRIASLVFVRTRMLREAPGLWTATVDFRVRMMEEL